MSIISLLLSIMFMISMNASLMSILLGEKDQLVRRNLVYTGLVITSPGLHKSSSYFNFERVNAALFSPQRLIDVLRELEK